MPIILRLLLVTVVAVLIDGCKTAETSEPFTPFEPRLRQAQVTQQTDVESSPVEYKTLVERGPEVRIEGQVVDLLSGKLGDNLQGGELVVSFNNMPIPGFINEVFGELLGLSFTIDPVVQKLNDLVTLRVIEPVSPSNLFQIAQRTLAAYGIGIDLQQNLYVFSPDRDVSTSDSPLVITGMALPEVPQSHRPYFVFVSLKVISNNRIINWLNQALKGAEISITQIPEGNSLLIQGRYDAVNQALAMIEALDQPLLRGKNSRLVEPAFSRVDQLSKDLVEVLKSEGYDASLRPPLGSVIILPLSSSNQIIVFAADDSVVDHVVDWAKKLDRQHALDIENGIFTYEVRNTDAKYLIELINELESSGSSTKEDGVRGSFVADTNRNAVVYKGSGKSWTQLLPAIKEMDKPAASVLVEVLLVEVTLNDQEATGMEFLARAGDVTFSTLGGFGLGGSGLSATLNRAGETRAVLNAFYENKRAKIMSRPRLLVKSGQVASIDVGNEIPLITSTSQSTDSPGTPVIQTVQYRRTGVLLTIEPIVHSSGYVDIKLTQELSEAQQTSTSSIDSPTIFNRKISTTVTLRDGGSVVLGGLISESISDTNRGVTGLGRIPIIGRLFGARSSSRDRTELLMMIIPYILPNPDEVIKLSDRMLELSDFE